MLMRSGSALVLVFCASNAGMASTSELLIKSRVILVFMCFLIVGGVCLVGFRTRVGGLIILLVSWFGW